jgi:hypothetical protein
MRNFFNRGRAGRSFRKKWLTTSSAAAAIISCFFQTTTTTASREKFLSFFFSAVAFDLIRKSPTPNGEITKQQQSSRRDSRV